MKLTEEQKQIAEEYGHLFNNTGGNEVVELAEREGVTYFNNPIVAELQGCMWSQIHLIERLKKERLLRTPVTDSTSQCPYCDSKMRDGAFMCESCADAEEVPE